MSDWQEITTAFKEPGNAGNFTGTLVVSMLVPKIQLAGGEYLSDFRYRYTVTAGQALQSDGGNMQLPITEDANPANTPLWFTLVDANGRQTEIGYAVIPRPADPLNPAITLGSVLTV